MDPEFIRDLFAPFRPVTVRRMFSGAGIFADGLMFGLIVDGAIHLKVDETNIADFEREGSRPFTYTRGKSSGRPTRHALPYWRLPERLYDDPDELAVWAEARVCHSGAQETGPARADQTKAGDERSSPGRAQRNPACLRKLPSAGFRFALSRLQRPHKKLCGSTSTSSLIVPFAFGAAASQSRR